MFLFAHPGALVIGQLALRQGSEKSSLKSQKTTCRPSPFPSGDFRKRKAVALVSTSHTSPSSRAQKASPPQRVGLTWGLH